MPYEKNNGVFWITPDWVTEPYNSSNIKIALNEEESYFYGDTCPKGTCPKYKVKEKNKVVEKTGGSVSYDFVKAAEIAHKRNWNFSPIVVPTDNLVEDWHRLVELKCRKKISINE